MDFVRDKDSVTSTLLAAEAGAYAKSQGSSFYKELLKIYTKTIYFKEHLIALIKKGISGDDEIKHYNNKPRFLKGAKLSSLAPFFVYLS